MGSAERFHAAENELIGPLSDGIEHLLAAYMDTAITSFGDTGQYVQPSTQIAGDILSVLNEYWLSAIVLGIEFQPELTTKANNLDVRTLTTYVQRYGAKKTKQIVQTTVNQLHSIVLNGQRSGLSRTDIAKQVINRIPAIARARAKVIAETEIHSASQFGAFNNALRSGQLLDKVWNTAGDERVRSRLTGSAFSHRAMQGVKSPLDIPFKVPYGFGSFEALMFPGDPDGSAGNIINCRCPMTFQQR